MVGQTCFGWSADMSRYRWLTPHKSVEALESFPAFDDADYSTRQQALHRAVSRGDVRTILNDELVPKAHILIYLALYARASVDQDAHVLPPDLSVNYDDLCAVFDRRNIDDRKVGRPSRSSAKSLADRLLAAEMHKMIARPNPIAANATQAAKLLIQSGRSPANSMIEMDSHVKRLVRQYQKHFSS